MSINYNTTFDFESQVKKILQKTKIKKSLNVSVADWLCDQGEDKKSLLVRHCADHIGITDIGGVAKIIKADFCRERICNVCAWRRQSKFLAQMFPVLEKIGNSCEYLFATLSVRNVPYEQLSDTIDVMLRGYDLLLKRRKIKRAWVGKIRGLEVTYNSTSDTFHPHIHIFVAVRPEYFFNSDLYISHSELCEYWRDCMSLDYSPVCSIEKVTETTSGAVETLKYSFKSSANTNALKGYYYALRHRRLISFSGIFAETRKFLRLSDFETVLTDDVSISQGAKIFYALYKFDATGGVYKYFDSLEMQV